MQGRPSGHAASVVIATDLSPPPGELAISAATLAQLHFGVLGRCRRGLYCWSRAGSIALTVLRAALLSRDGVAMDAPAVGNEKDPSALMARYFAGLQDGDAVQHLTEDVVWVNEETGQRITGRTAVIAYVRALHVRMGDLRTRTYIVGQDAAMVEGDCMPVSEGRAPGGEEPTGRLPFVVVYDLKPGGIAAMRLHMAITRLPAET